MVAVKVEVTSDGFVCAPQLTRVTKLYSHKNIHFIPTVARQTLDYSRFYKGLHRALYSPNLGATRVKSSITDDLVELFIKVIHEEWGVTPRVARVLKDYANSLCATTLKAEVPDVYFSRFTRF